jgi:hypothetical protein
MPTLTDWIQASSSAITLIVVCFTFQLTRRMSHDPYQSLIKPEEIIYGTGEYSKINIRVNNWGPGVADDIYFKNMRTRRGTDTLTASGPAVLLKGEHGTYVFPSFEIRLQTIFVLTCSTTSGQQLTTYWRCDGAKFHRITGARRIRSYLLQSLRAED